MRSFGCLYRAVHDHSLRQHLSVVQLDKELLEIKLVLKVLVKYQLLQGPCNYQAPLKHYHAYIGKNILCKQAPCSFLLYLCNIMFTHVSVLKYIMLQKSHAKFLIKIPFCYFQLDRRVKVSFSNL